MALTNLEIEKLTTGLYRFVKDGEKVRCEEIGFNPRGLSIVKLSLGELAAEYHAGLIYKQRQMERKYKERMWQYERKVLSWQ